MKRKTATWIVLVFATILFIAWTLLNTVFWPVEDYAVEDRLNEMTAEADRRFGQRAIEPAAERPAEERAGHARA